MNDDPYRGGAERNSAGLSDVDLGRVWTGVAAELPPALRIDTDTGNCPVEA